MAVQGDPLFPFIFMFVLEDSSQIIGSATSDGYINGFRVGGEERSYAFNVSFTICRKETIILWDF